MKRLILCCLALFSVLCLAGCSDSSEAEGATSDTSETEVAETVMSEEEYNLIRQIFVAQYRSVMAEIQQQITSFSNNDDWWNQTTSLEQQASSAAASFSENAPYVPESKQEDYNNILSAVAAYEQAVNTLNAVKGSSSSDQKLRLSEAAEQMMQATGNWNQVVQ